MKMNLIAAITTDDIAVWTAVGIALIAMFKAFGSAAIAAAADLRSQANQTHLVSQQAQISAVQLATPTTPPPAAPARVNINYDALATALAPVHTAAVAAAVKAQANWPTPSATIPPKAQQ